MRRTIFATALALGCVAAMPSAWADDGAGRYELHQADGGFIRLDTKTGAVSHCRQKGTGWVCESAADDRKAFRDEIARLDAENRQLRERLAGLETRPGGQTGPRTGQQDDYLRLPSDEEIDRIMGFFEKIMRRFMDFARSLDGDKGQET